VAAVPGVRAALLAFQRGFGREHGAVLDGRDIGTVIFPDAQMKFFVTASVRARGERRCKELRERGIAADVEAVIEELRRRDAADAARSTSPLKPAKDAVLLDTTALDADAAFAMAKALMEARLGARWPFQPGSNTGEHRTSNPAVPPGTGGLP
jgi:CMP/dCMP kinase